MERTGSQQVVPANPLQEIQPNNIRLSGSQSNKNIMLRLLALLWGELKSHSLLTIALLAAVITSFFNKPQWAYIDAKVIVCLFELMLIVKALEEYGLLHVLAVRIANRCRDERQLTTALLLIAFFLSMFTTNDVAVLTIIPILIVIAQSSGFSAAFPSVLVTVAANLGSSMTPFGNPQNLYLFSFFHMNPASFFGCSVPLGVISLLVLVVSGRFVRPKPIQLKLAHTPVTEKKKAAAFLVLLVPVIAGVMNLIPYWVALLFVLPVTLLLDRSFFAKPDYRLLLTFVFLFIAVGNLSHIPALSGIISALAHTPIQAYLSSLVLSQVISNVPSVVMLAPFSTHAQALFYGVNIGGLCTPIASLASIIALSLYSQSYTQGKGQLMRDFLLYNVGLLILLGGIFAVVVARF
jgi:Na+/H+ antiporter NhaD/arsenite permease-like protein